MAIKRLFVFLIIFQNSFSVFSQRNVLTLHPNLDVQIIKTDLWIYNEIENQPETFLQIKNKSQAFQLSTSPIPNFRTSPIGHWLNYKITSKTDQTAIISLDFDAYNTVEFYVHNLTDDSLITFKPQNWKLPIEEREIKSNRFAVSFLFKAGKVYDIYYRIQKTRGTIKVPFRLLSPSTFEAEAIEISLYFGFFIGVISIIILLAISLYFNTKDKVYLYYAMASFFMLLWRLVFEGYFWDDLLKIYPPIADPTLGNLFLLLFIWYHIGFLKRFLLVKNKSPKYLVKMGSYLQRIVLFFMIPAVVLPLNPRLISQLNPTFYFLYIFYLALLILYIVDGLRRKTRLVYFYIISIAPLIINTTLVILSNLGFIDSDFVYYNIYLWTFLFEMVVLCFGMAFRFQEMSRVRERLLLNLNKQQKALFESEKLSREQEIKKVEAQLKLQTEKTRISRDLHDSVGSQLTYIISNLDFLGTKLKDKEEFYPKIEALSDFTRSTMQQLRDTIWSITKESVTVEQFIIRLQNYALKQFENQEIELKIDSKPNPNESILNSFQMLHLYRIAQECINNTIKHAQATVVLISIIQVENKIFFQFEDNGVGFETFQTLLENNMGLKNIKLRVEEMAGHYEIISEPDNGTKININFEIENTPISV